MSYLASAITVDFVTFTEEILSGKLHFLCSEKARSRQKTSKSKAINSHACLSLSKKYNSVFFRQNL